MVVYVHENLVHLKVRVFNCIFILYRGDYYIEYWNLEYDCLEIQFARQVWR